MLSFENRKLVFAVFLVFSLVLSIVSLASYEYFFVSLLEKVTLDNAVIQSEDRETVFKNFINDHALYLNSICRMAIFESYLNDVDQELQLLSAFMTLSMTKRTMTI